MDVCPTLRHRRAACGCRCGTALEQVLGKIAESAFKGFDKVESANLPKDLKVIGEQAFFGCQGLVTVTLSEGFTTLGHACFKGTGHQKRELPEEPEVHQSCLVCRVPEHHWKGTNIVGDL